MGFIDRFRFTSKLKTSWNQAKAKSRLDDLIDSSTCEADLIKEPEYIVNNVIKNVTKIAIDGALIGGSADFIPQQKIKEVEKSPWTGTYFYHCTNGATYKVISGMIVDLFMNRELAAKTGLRREEDVLNNLGKPDKIKATKNGPILLLNVYIYKKRHLAIEIDTTKEVARINIFRFRY